MLLRSGGGGRGLGVGRGILAVPRRLASGHHHHEEETTKMERKSDDYRPGSDSYAYDNPWPKLNKGRLDWLFGDGWRRPLAKDQGAKMRREWLWFAQVSHDEYRDWRQFHGYAWVIFTCLTMWTTLFMWLMKPDWPNAKEWSRREAHLELARRQKAGLPLISKDLIDPDKVLPTLPSDEELRDFPINI